MSLANWKRNFDLNLDPLARSARRVAVVLPTCPVDPSAPLESRAAIFTTRADRGALARQTGLKVHPLSRAALFAELSPSVVQRLVAPNAAGLQQYSWFEVEAPSARPARAGDAPALRIAPTGYLMTRASSASDQECFQPREGASLPDDWVGQGSGPDGTDRSMARIRRASSILRRLEGCLDVWARFAGRSERLTYAFLLVLQRCGSLPLPPFTPGETPPPGLLRAVQRLLLDESSSTGIDLSQVEWAAGPGLWPELGRQVGLRENLAAVAGAFRDALRGLAPQHESFEVAGLPLSEVVEQVLDRHPELGPEFVLEYRRAITALQEIRELLRLKSIQGNVLLGVLESYKRIEAVRHLDGNLDEHRRNTLVEKEILRRDSPELRAPRERPSPAARAAYTKELVRQIEQVVDAVADDDEAALASLPPELQALTHRLRADPQVARTLGRVVGQPGADRKRFKNTLQTLVEGVLCPALFGAPELHLLELVTLVGSWLGESYFSAIKLSPEDCLGVRAIGERHEERFRANVSDGVIGAGVAEVNAAIANDLIRGEVATEARAALSERAYSALNTAITGHTLLALSPDWRASPLPTYPSQAGAVSEVVRSSAANLTPRSEEVRVLAGCVAKQLVDRKATAELDPLRVPRAVRRVLVRLRADGEAEAGSTDAGGPPGEDPVADDNDSFSLCLLSATEAATGSEQILADRLGGDRRFRDAVTESELAWSEFLHTVLRRYADGHVPEAYGRGVRRLLLAELMLDMKEDLNLGKPGSFLYRLLLDLVHDHGLDGGDGDFRAFLRHHSITDYIDVMQAGGGSFFRPIEQTVERGETAFRKLSGYLSDVAGLALTFDRLARVPDVEILVFNGTVDDWVDWVRQDTFSDDDAAGRFYPGRLAEEGAHAHGYCAPALVHLTDSAFAGTQSKLQWLQQRFSPGAYTTALCQGHRWAVHPPIVLGEGRDGESKLPPPSRLEPTEGPLAVAVHWYGPPPALNRREDGMATVLPAGFLLTVQLLGGSLDGLRNPGLKRRSQGRLHVVGAGARPLGASLGSSWWSSGQLDAQGELVEHPVVADAYLHLLLVLEAAAQAHGGPDSRRSPDDRPEGVYTYAVRDNAAFNDAQYQQSTAWRTALPGGSPLRISLDGNPAQGKLAAVRVCLDDRGTVMVDGGPVAATRDIAWFTTLRGVLGFPVAASSTRAA